MVSQTRNTIDVAESRNQKRKRKQKFRTQQCERVTVWTPHDSDMWSPSIVYGEISATWPRVAREGIFLDSLSSIQTNNSRSIPYIYGENKSWFSLGGILRFTVHLYKNQPSCGVHVFNPNRSDSINFTPRGWTQPLDWLLNVIDMIVGLFFHWTDFSSTNRSRA